MCPECNETIETDLKIELGSGGRDARTNSNSLLQVIWEHFKTKHAEAQPHAWRLYEKSCEMGEFKIFPCYGCQKDFAKINDWNMHKFSRHTQSCPYHFQSTIPKEVPMVVQATLNRINHFGFSVRHDRSIKCPLCHHVADTMTNMSEHFRSHLTESTHRKRLNFINIFSFFFNLEFGLDITLYHIRFKVMF